MTDHKIGRPKVKKSEQKRYQVSMYLDAEEMEFFRAVVKASGLHTASAFLRNRCAGALGHVNEKEGKNG